MKEGVYQTARGALAGSYIFNWKTNGINKFCSDYRNETKVQPEGESSQEYKPSTASWEENRV